MMKKLTSTLTLLLAGLLVAAPAFALGPDDDPEKDGDAPADDPQQELHVRYVPSYQNYFQPATRAQFYVNFGYGTVEQYYDNDGDLQDLGDITLPTGTQDLGAEVQSYAVHVGGTYALSQIGTMKVRLGADLSLYDRRFQSDGFAPIGLDAQDQSSGFAPQNLSVYGEIAQPAYKLRAGYFFDLGPEAGGADELENTDMQNAVMLGISGQYPTETFRLFAGLDYFITLKGELDDGTEFDTGDVAVVHAGAGFRIIPSAEIGATLLYRINTEGELGDLSGGDVDANGAPNEFAGGNSVGIAPYVTYAPMNSPYQFYVKGAVQREYYDYGYTVAGENDIAPRLGFTVGLIYGLDV